MKEKSSLVSIQFTEDKSFLFVGFTRRDNLEKFVVEVKKFRVPEKTSEALDELIVAQTTVIGNYYKTPILTVQDVKSFEDECSNEMMRIKKEMEELLRPFIGFLDHLINKEPPAPIDPTPEDTKNTNPSRPGAPPKKPEIKAGLKGAQTGPSTSESVTPTKAGIESMVLLLDERYMSLPFEQLQVFSEVPVISKDYSLQIHHRRNTNYSSESGGEFLSGKKVQYIAYDTKLAEGEAKGTHVQFSNLVQLLKEAKLQGISGVNSNERIPSIGNWQLSLREADTLIYYGSKPFLHMISPSTLLDLSNTSQVRFFIISDRLNPLKKHIRKFESLDPDQELVSIKTMPTLTLALLTLMGASTIVYNRGAYDNESNLEQIHSILNQISSQDSPSVSSALMNARKGRKILVSESTGKSKSMLFDVKEKKIPVVEENQKKNLQAPPKRDEKPQSGRKDGRGEDIIESFEEYNELGKLQYSILGVGAVRMSNNT